MISPAIIVSSHGLSNVDVFAIPDPDNDIVNQMPVLRSWMLSLCLAFVSLVEQGNSDKKFMTCTFDQEEDAI